MLVNNFLFKYGFLFSIKFSKFPDENYVLNIFKNNDKIIEKIFNYIPTSFFKLTFIVYHI